MTRWLQPFYDEIAVGLTIAFVVIIAEAGRRATMTWLRALVRKEFDEVEERFRRLQKEIDLRTDLLVFLVEMLKSKAEKGSEEEVQLNNIYVMLRQHLQGADAGEKLT